MNIKVSFTTTFVMCVCDLTLRKCLCISLYMCNNMCIVKPIAEKENLTQKPECSSTHWLKLMCVPVSVQYAL